jgi:hypothetical protein
MASPSLAPKGNVAAFSGRACASTLGVFRVGVPYYAAIDGMPEGTNVNGFPGCIQRDGTHVKSLRGQGSRKSWPQV